MASATFMPTVQRVFASSGDFIFRFLAPFLHDQLHCRVLVGDLRGFGDSTDFQNKSATTYSAYSPEGVADDVVQLIDELHARHSQSGFLLLGNSLAAAAMVIAADKCSSMVRALVLLGPILHDSSADKWFRPLSHVLFPALYGRFMWIPYYRTLFPGTKPADWEHEIALLEAHLRAKKRNVTNVGRFCRASKAVAAKTLETIGTTKPTLPMLAFFGREDPDYSDFDAELQWVRHAMPQIEIVVEDDGGHYLHVEVLDKVVTAIQIMLAKTQQQ